MKGSRLIAAAPTWLLVVLAASVPSRAHAESAPAQAAAPSDTHAHSAAPIDRKFYGSIAAYFAWGSRFGGNPNDYRFGGSIQAGVTLPFRLYLGAFATPYAGGDKGDVSRHTNQYGADLGFDKKLLGGHFLLRPLLGLGAERLKQSVAGTSHGDTSFLFMIGLSANVVLGRRFFLSGQARISISPHGDSKTFGGHLLVGAGTVF